MIEQTINVAIPMFEGAFPHHQAVSLFDNTANHCAFSDDALVASRMNLKKGGQQPVMKNGYNYYLQRPQSMVTADNTPKGINKVLEERNLWPQGRFLLDCKPSCTKNPPIDTGIQCCARKTLFAQRDFREQKGKL